MNKANSTELLNNLNSDISSICMISDSAFFSAATQIFNIIGGMIGLFVISPKLALLVLCFIPIKFFLAKKLSSIRKQLVMTLMSKYANFAKWFGDTVGGIKEIKVFGIFNKK